jgi:hypothetical protein
MNIWARQGEEDIERRIARGRGADLCLWDIEAAAARFMGPSASGHLISIGRALVSNDRVGVASHVWPAIRVEGNKMWHRKGDAGGGANYLVLLLSLKSGIRGTKRMAGCGKESDQHSLVLGLPCVHIHPPKVWTSTK